MEQVSSLVTQKLEDMVEATDLGALYSKREAISTLFIYVILEQGRQERMANAISHALRASDTWNFIKPYTSMLFFGPNTFSMNSLIVLLSPYIYWANEYHSKGDVIRWAAAASSVPYTEEVGRDVVGALLQISMCDSLRPHTPIEIWRWLKKHSTLPPVYREQGMNITGNAVRYIRELGDIEIFKSFFILAWSESSYICDENHTKNSLREDFCGIGMWGHRKDLVERLDRILLDDQSGRSRPYEELKTVLLEVETEAAKTLTRTMPKLLFFCKYADSRKWGRTQNRTPPSPVLCPSPTHDLSPHAVSVRFQHPVLVLPPHPFRSRYISLLSKPLCSCIWIR